MMNWLPVAPDFSGDLRTALGSPDATDCLAKLASLAGYRLGFLETIQLNRALDRPDRYCPIVRGERRRLPMRLASGRDLPKSGSACTTIVMARSSTVTN